MRTRSPVIAGNVLLALVLVVVGCTSGSHPAPSPSASPSAPPAGRPAEPPTPAGQAAAPASPPATPAPNTASMPPAPPRVALAPMVEMLGYMETFVGILEQHKDEPAEAGRLAHAWARERRVLFDRLREEARKGVKSIGDQEAINRALEPLLARGQATQKRIATLKRENPALFRNAGVLRGLQLIMPAEIPD